MNWVIICSGNGLPPVQWPTTSHYLIQYVVIISWTLINKFQWNFNSNTPVCSQAKYSQENAFQDTICQTAAILFMSQFNTVSFVCGCGCQADIYADSKDPLININWPNSQIPECTCSISHNAPFRTEMCTFLFWMVYCGICNRCILGYVRLLY